MNLKGLVKEFMIFKRLKAVARKQHKAMTVTVASFQTWRGWPHIPLPLLTTASNTTYEKILGQG